MNDEHGNDWINEIMVTLKSLNDKMVTKNELTLLEKGINGRLDEMTKKFTHFEEKMSLMEDKIAFYGYQAKGGGTPKEVRRVPGGYGLLEPPSTWRRERYGR